MAVRAVALLLLAKDTFPELELPFVRGGRILRRNELPPVLPSRFDSSGRDASVPRAQKAGREVEVPPRAFAVMAGLDWRMMLPLAGAGVRLFSLVRRLKAFDPSSAAKDTGRKEPRRRIPADEPLPPGK